MQRVQNAPLVGDYRVSGLVPWPMAEIKRDLFR